jgi:hypothetical protein
MKSLPGLGALACVLFSAATVSLFAQGLLTPPGAPAPTMKALDQIASSGTAINATNTPGDTSYHFIISSPGSYYFVLSDSSITCSRRRSGMSQIKATNT